MKKKINWKKLKKILKHVWQAFNTLTQLLLVIAIFISAIEGLISWMMALVILLGFMILMDIRDSLEKISKQLEPQELIAVTVDEFKEYAHEKDAHAFGEGIVGRNIYSGHKPTHRPTPGGQQTEK